MMSPDGLEPVLTVSEFVALVNQTFDYAFPGITITGELANLRVSKNRWLYFDLKDEQSTVKFFGTVYQLPGPLEDGMLLKVRGTPRLHNQYGFSVNVQSIQAAGEGAIRRAAELLQAKLAREGLFDENRKRPLPYPPTRIGLVTSGQSAAYADFMKVLSARWSGLDISFIDVQVQGEIAPQQIVSAIEQMNEQPEPPEVLVVIRGGGSPEDLAAFSTESVVRAVAASRIPTLVAIGHEVDISLAELAADQRASTPSNAAELLVPDRDHVLTTLADYERQLYRFGRQRIITAQDLLKQTNTLLQQALSFRLRTEQERLRRQTELLSALDPEAALRRGYALIRQGESVIRSGRQLKENGIVQVHLSDAHFEAKVGKIIMDES